MARTHPVSGAADSEVWADSARSSGRVSGGCGTGQREVQAGAGGAGEEGGAAQGGVGRARAVHVETQLAAQVLADLVVGVVLDAQRDEVGRSVAQAGP